MMEMTDIQKSFGKIDVLKGVNLKVDQPGIWAIVGPNGSGKTTFIKCILGMVLPDQGGITVEGQQVRNRWRYREKIGYLPQIARFPENLTVLEVINMLKDLRKEDADETPLIERFELQPYLSSKLRNLSGGTRQKVNIVLCFMFDSQYLILDEPTAGLDPVALISLKELIEEERSKGKIILLTTHIMDLVEQLADEIVFLLEGRIFFKGSLSEMQHLTGETKLEKSIASILLKKDNPHHHYSEYLLRKEA